MHSSSSKHPLSLYFRNFLSINLLSLFFNDSDLLWNLDLWGLSSESIISHIDVLVLLNLTWSSLWILDMVLNLKILSGLPTTLLQSSDYGVQHSKNLMGGVLIEFFKPFCSCNDWLPPLCWDAFILFAFDSCFLWVFSFTEDIPFNMYVYAALYILSINLRSF